MLTRLAPAKINLSLRIHGKRPDGYHELESLVVFASACDRLTLSPSRQLSLQVEGPFSSTVGSGDNLVERAALAASAAEPRLQCGAFRLHKALPVAAGIGGGSADAAAALHLIREANPEFADTLDWMAVAASLGADVPVCFTGKPAWMSGIGERVDLLPTLPEFSLLLVNPTVPLSTRAIFMALAAPPLGAQPRMPYRPSFVSLEHLLDYLRTNGNDLTQPALAICPVIATVLGELERREGLALARMSGSGPTCFALFRSQAACQAAAEALSRDRPTWWVTPATLMPIGADASGHPSPAG